MMFNKPLTQGKISQQQGNIAVEMAFSLSLFLTTLMATIEITRLFWMGYWLDYNFHQAIKDVAWNPGLGIESRLKTRLDSKLFDNSKLTIKQKTVPLGSLYLTEYTVSYPARFHFLPQQAVTFNSTSWLGDNENDII